MHVSCLKMSSAYLRIPPRHHPTITYMQCWSSNPLDLKANRKTLGCKEGHSQYLVKRFQSGGGLLTWALGMSFVWLDRSTTYPFSLADGNVFAQAYLRSHGSPRCFILSVLSLVDSIFERFFIVIAQKAGPVWFQISSNQWSFYAAPALNYPENLETNSDHWN